MVHPNDKKYLWNEWRIQFIQTETDLTKRCTYLISLFIPQPNTQQTQSQVYVWYNRYTFIWDISYEILSLWCLQIGKHWIPISDRNTLETEPLNKQPTPTPFHLPSNNDSMTTSTRLYIQDVNAIFPRIGMRNWFRIIYRCIHTFPQMTGYIAITSNWNWIEMWVCWLKNNINIRSVLSLWGTIGRVWKQNIQTVANNKNEDNRGDQDEISQVEWWWK